MAEIQIKGCAANRFWISNYDFAKRLYFMRRSRYDPMAPENVLAALMRMAAEAASRRIRKGDKRPASEVARAVATKKRMARDKRRAAWQARLKARPKGVMKWAPIGERVTDRLLAVMRPGAWYGQRDIVRAVGYPRGYNSKVLQVLLPRSLVERRRNPAYRGPVSMRGAFRGEADPIWLYRLTRKGELERESVMLIGVVPYGGPDVKTPQG